MSGRPSSTAMLFCRFSRKPRGFAGSASNAAIGLKCEPFRILGLKVMPAACTFALYVHLNAASSTTLPGEVRSLTSRSRPAVSLTHSSSRMPQRLGDAEPWTTHRVHGQEKESAALSEAIEIMIQQQCEFCQWWTANISIRYTLNRFSVSSLGPRDKRSTQDYHH
jgi:hypothetical protein